MTGVPWTWMLIRSSGVTAFLLLTAVVALGLLLRTRLLRAAPPRLLTVHRFVAVLALGFLAVHMLLLLVDPVVRFLPYELLVPFTSHWRPAAVGAGVLAFWLLLAPVAVTGMRSRLGRLAPSLFNRTHLAAYAAWPLALGHFAASGSDTGKLWGVTAIAVTGVVVTVLLTVRGVVGRRARRA